MDNRHNDHLYQAVTEELQRTQGLTAEEAHQTAGDILPNLKDRFSNWIRREYHIVHRKQIRKNRQEQIKHHPELDNVYYERMNLNLRIQHVTMALAVLTLIFTGLPLKFPDYAVSRAIINFFGGVGITPIIHRIGATFLIVVGLWHLGYIIMAREGRKTFKMLLPAKKDATDIFKQIRYFLHLSDERPKFDKYSYVEKFDYWAVYWGMVVMIFSGLALWFTNIFLQFFPLWATDIAKEAHSDEALLATLAIVIWHFYNVHLNPHCFPMNPTFITGKISARQMIEEHGAEYERLMTAKEETAPATGGER